MSQPPPDSSRRPRRNVWTIERRTIFLEALRVRGSVSRAARSAGMSREGAYRLRRRCPAFARAWDAAMAYDLVAPPRQADPGSLWERAMIGTAREIRYHGKRVGIVRRYDDTALLRLLKRFDRHHVKGHTLSS
jgi:hypothetical protein